MAVATFARAAAPPTPLSYSTTFTDPSGTQQSVSFTGTASGTSLTGTLTVNGAPEQVTATIGSVVAIVLGAWLLVGRPAPWIDDWSMGTPGSFRTQVSCERYLGRRRAVATSPQDVWFWEHARCVTKEEFDTYPKLRE